MLDPKTMGKTIGEEMRGLVAKIMAPLHSRTAELEARIARLEENTLGAKYAVVWTPGTRRKRAILYARRLSVLLSQ